MNLELTTPSFAFTAICDTDTGRPISVLYVGDDSPDEDAICAALNARFPGYAYAIKTIAGWDATGDEIDGRPEAIAHLRETTTIAAEERAYLVEGCGADQTLTATSPESAAREAAEWQYGDDGATPVTLTWVGTGPDGGSVAEYRAEWVETIGAESVTQTKRLVVREAD